METIIFPKRKFELELQGTKSQKESIIDAAVKAFQSKMLFDNKLSPLLFTKFHMPT
jgi:hypothetical protein